jgi:uncharacterized RDD family membrane protein YckC
VATNQGFDPYEPPRYDEPAPEQPKAEGRPELATRFSRWGAAFIDALLVRVFSMTFSFVRDLPAINLQSYPVRTLIWAAIHLFVYLALHGYLLAKNGQTLGKRLFSIRIVNYDDHRRTPVARLFGQRVLPVHALVSIPTVGPLLIAVDSLFIFRADHRCLHDEIAGTIVVKGNPSE